MTINLNTKTNKVDTNTDVGHAKSESIGTKNTGTETIDETFGIEDLPGTEETTPSSGSSIFDDYMCGDTTGGTITSATANDPGILQYLQDFPPSLDQVLEAHPNAVEYLDVIDMRYQNAIADLTALRKSLVNLQFTGNISANESAAVTAKIEAINVALAKCEVELQNTRAHMEQSNNIYHKELISGKDLNGDRWIGRPHHEGSYGVKQTEDGQTVYIDPTTGTVLDHPPYSNPDYEPKIASGNIQVVGNDEYIYSEDQPTANLTLQITSSEADPESALNTAYECYGSQYFWVERDGKSFEPKVDYQHDTVGDTKDEDAVPAEPHYNLAEFTTDANGAVVQKTPEDKSRYIQVEVAETVVTSEPTTEEGKGFDHFVEFFDKDHTLICRVRITGCYNPSDPAACPDNSILYASTVGFAFNTDNVFSPGMRYDFSGYQSTGRHIAGEEKLLSLLEIEAVPKPEVPIDLNKVTEDDLLKEELEKYDEAWKEYWIAMDAWKKIQGKPGLSPVQPQPPKLPSKLADYISPEELNEYNAELKKYWAYKENISLFADVDYEMNVWGHAKDNKAKDSDWAEIKRTAPPGTTNTVYIDPKSDEATAKTVEANIKHNGSKFVENIATETIATPLTGVMMYGLGTRGHIIGTDYNDIIKVSDVDALFQNDYYREHYPHAKPMEKDSPFYKTIIEGRAGNNIVRGYGGDHHVEGVTFAWFDGNRGDQNYIFAQGASSPSGSYDSENERFSPPVNPKSYIHVDTPGGETFIHNPDEVNTVMQGEAAKKDNDNGESWWTSSTYDDYYDISSGDVKWTNITDQDALDAMGAGNIGDRNQVDQSEFSTVIEEAAAELWEEIIKIEKPENADMLVEEWLQQSGHTAEMQSEMDSFFNTMFGISDDLTAEYAEAEVMNSF